MALRRSLAGAGLAAAILLSGCTIGEADSDPISTPTQNLIQPGTPGEPNRTLTAAPEIPDLVIEADVRFVQHMLQHHAQAVEMTALVPERSSRTDLGLFAERISVSQDEEIDIMQSWLRERGEPVLDPTAEHHGPDVAMPGMLTVDQLDELEVASEDEFDRLFLRYMYQHHEGAVQMVDELLSADGAQDSFIFNLAKEIDSDQRIEMDRILEMQVEMGTGDYGTHIGDD